MKAVHDNKVITTWDQNPIGFGLAVIYAMPSGFHM